MIVIFFGEKMKKKIEMKIKMNRYLPKQVVEYIINSKEHMPKLRFWKSGEAFGLKYKYIELRNFKIDWKHGYVVESKNDNKAKDDIERVFLIKTSKGYSLSALHGYYGYHELVETTKYKGLWWKDPQKWREIADESS